MYSLSGIIDSLLTILASYPQKAHVVVTNAHQAPAGQPRRLPEPLQVKVTAHCAQHSVYNLGSDASVIFFFSLTEHNDIYYFWLLGFIFVTDYF